MFRNGPLAMLLSILLLTGSAMAGDKDSIGSLEFSKSKPKNLHPSMNFNYLWWFATASPPFEEPDSGSSLEEGEEDLFIDAEKESLAEIDRKLNNPLVDLWSLSLQNNYNLRKGDLVSGTHSSNTLFFQPALPIPFGEEDDMIFIARPVFPLVTNPDLDPASRNGVDGHDTGIGDIQVLSLLGPNRDDGWVWGVGPTLKFPTADQDSLGSGKYQAGPAGMLFKIGKPWTYGALVQHWWSYAGEDGRSEVSQTDLQYTVRYALPDAWSIGMGPTVTIDWKADSDDKLTLPVGLGLTKTVRIGEMPVKLRLETHYSVIRPDSYGTEWTFRFQITPVISSPFRPD